MSGKWKARLQTLGHFDRESPEHIFKSLAQHHLGILRDNPAHLARQSLGQRGGEMPNPEAAHESDAVETLLGTRCCREMD